MKFRTWPVMALAMGGLLLLIGLSVVATRRRTGEIYEQLEGLNARHRKVETRLRRLRSDVHLSGILVRDSLLDTSQSAGPEYREQLATLRATMRSTLADLEALVGEREGPRVQRLHSNVDDYWQAFDPLFDWTPAEKAARSLRFLRQEVVPRRDAVLTITREIEAFNDANTRDQRAQVASREQELQAHLNRILWGSLSLGVLVALAATVRIRLLEARSQEQHQRTERTETELRRLSHRLVRAQEDERRRLARELHDEVGQMLTALRMQLGRAERTRSATGSDFAGSVAECKGIIDTILRTVRDLSMGLRPAMLDDFGLGSALDWHVRDFSRRCDVPVYLFVHGNVDRLAEPHRTCVYRVVQEALTNCARHARASRVEVNVRDQGDCLRLTIQDDGVGLDAGEDRQIGAGLVGIQERLREIGGSLSIESGSGFGTTLHIEIPVSAGPEARDENPAR
jgi:signal transduction histidine kinase